MDSRLLPEDPADSSALSPSDEQLGVWLSKEVLPHEPALRTWLKARYPSLADSDDIVQESYARLLRTRRPDRIANAKAYLFSVARNLAMDLFRRHRVGPVMAAGNPGLNSVIEDRTDVVDAVCSAQEYEILKQAIEALPERCRTIMVMQKLQGLSNLAIAERLSLSVNTVNAQLVIGLARCRAYLKARGVLRGRKP